jgi:hypothetical protein
MPALKIEGDLGFAQFISNTSYYHRKEETGYDGTLYNLGFYQIQPNQAETEGALAVIPYARHPGVNFPLLDGTGMHLPAGATNYTARRPRSTTASKHHPGNPPAIEGYRTPLFWTTGMFFAWTARPTWNRFTIRCSTN